MEQKVITLLDGNALNLPLLLSDNPQDGALEIIVPTKGVSVVTRGVVNSPHHADKPHIEKGLALLGGNQGILVHFPGLAVVTFVLGASRVGECAMLRTRNKYLTKMFAFRIGPMLAS